jgi:hypothetical protein
MQPPETFDKFNHSLKSKFQFLDTGMRALKENDLGFAHWTNYRGIIKMFNGCDCKNDDIAGAYK